MSTKRKADAIVNPKLDRFMRGVMLEATGRIMRRTPVDTGRARANWNASVNRVDTSINEAATVADGPTKSRANARTVGAIRFSKGDVGFLHNGLPYIVPLEDGSSTQAPQGMVRITMEEMRSFVRRQRG